MLIRRRFSRIDFLFLSSRIQALSAATSILVTSSDQRRDMNSVARRLSSLFRDSGFGTGTFNMQQLQQCRGIRVPVFNGNLEAALAQMQRKMQSSGIERMIKKEQRFHIKNSEKRVLARKNLERKIRSEDLAKKLKTIMIKKIRGI